MSFVSKFLGAAAAVLLLVPTVLSAHVHWTQVNSVNADTLALYHFDEHHAAVGDAIEPDAGITTPGLDLIVGSTAGTGASAVHDTPDTIFDPHGLKLTSTQDLATTGSLAGTDSDVTVEFWFKWDATVTSQTLTLGLQSTASIVLARDINVPANDKFGVAFTHGDYVSAPGFTNWVDAGSEEASLDEWRHYAVTIHSTGMTLDIPSGHDL